jgi:hypothetical protein
MLHACVERFDVMGVRGNILGWDGEVNKALLHNKTENDKRILCSCKIFGWECVGDSIPVKPTIPYLHVASFHTFHFVNLIFQTFAASLHLLCH